MPAPDDVEVRVRQRVARIKRDKLATVPAEAYLQDVEAMIGLLQIAIERLQRIAGGEDAQKAVTRTDIAPRGL